MWIIKKRHLRLAANCKEGREIDIKSFYVTCLGYYGIMVLLCCHDIMSNTREGKFPIRRSLITCEASRPKEQWNLSKDIIIHTILAYYVALEWSIFITYDVMSWYMIVWDFEYEMVAMQFSMLRHDWN